MKKLGYAKHNDSDVIYQIVCDNEDGTVDLNIDDIQGDIMVCCVDKRNIVLVEEIDYLNRINYLNETF
jgi:hypothetical protein